jgi:hypothetical protein
MALDKFGEYDPASLLHDIGTDNPFDCVIGALDQDVRLQPANEIERRVAVKAVSARRRQ